MNDQQQQQQPAGPPDTTKYENQHGIEKGDEALVAAFAKKVGNELFTVDHQNVGSNSNIKALQLDQKKIFADVPTKPSPAPKQVVTKPVQEPGISVPESPSKTPPATILAQPQLPASDSTLLEYERRLSKLEHATNAFKKAKRIKRGINYSVSSNGFKGEIKDAELLAEFIISEVAKGVKTITIRANDSQNSKQK